MRWGIRSTPQKCASDIPGTPSYHRMTPPEQSTKVSRAQLEPPRYVLGSQCKSVMCPLCKSTITPQQAKLILLAFGNDRDLEHVAQLAEYAKEMKDAQADADQDDDLTKPRR